MEMGKQTRRSPRHRLEPPAVHPETFPLYHADLRVNNIYVDDSNITCVVDWAFASSVPESILLIPPRLPQYSDEICLELRMSFIDGFVASPKLWRWIHRFVQDWDSEDMS
jgi:hypothetical protein